MTKKEILGLIRNFRGDKKTLKELNPVLEAITDLAAAGGNVQANWSETDSSKDDFIKNKPTIPTRVSDLTNDSHFVTGADIANIVALSQDDYDSLDTKVATTLYVITENEESGS